MLSANRGVEEIFESDGLEVKPAEVKLASKSDKSIITASVSPCVAFEVFCGKSFTTHVTRSDTIYTVESSKLELPWQKIARIKQELFDLNCYLDSKVQEQVESEATVWSILSQEAHIAEGLSADVQNHAALKYLESNASKVSINFIAEAIADLKQHSRDNSEKNVNLTVTSNQIDFSSLENRILYLESLLGNHLNVLDMEAVQSNATAITKNLSSSMPSVTYSTVLESLVKLEQKVNLLDPTAIDLLKGKVATLRLELETALKSKSSSDSKVFEAYKKIEDIYSFIRKVESIGDNLPNLILRMKSVEGAHNSLINVSDRLLSLERSLDKLSTDSNMNSELIASLKKGLEDNLVAMQFNIERVDKTIENLKP